MIFAIQNAIPKNLIDYIRSSVEDVLLVQETSRFDTMYNRMGDTICISKTPQLKEVDVAIANFICDFSKEVVQHRYSPEHSTGDSGYEYHRYAPGDMYFPQSDGATSFARGESSCLLRYATVVMHLNTVDEGGETVFPIQNHSVKTLEGQVLVFPPYGTHPHYVTPSRQTREIVMTWLVYTGINVIRT